MRRISLVAGLFAFAAACGPGEEPATDTMATAAMAPTISLADVAGTWNMQVMPMDRDSVILTAQLNASADPSAWSIKFDGRDPIPMRPMADGDSIIVESGPYASALRANQQVTTRGVMRMSNGELRGTTTAHYQTSGADSVVQFRTVATKN